jgi:hypothetical protein
MINGKISEKPLRALRLGCRVHGTTGVVVQVAMPVLPSRGSTGDLKHPNQPGLKVLEGRAAGWPCMSYRRKEHAGKRAHEYYDENISRLVD